MNIFENIDSRIIKYIAIVLILLFCIIWKKLNIKRTFKTDASEEIKYGYYEGAYIPKIKHDYSIDYVKAHIYCANNKNALSKDSKCGCFHCIKIFDPKEITSWCCIRSDDNDTAICPYCGIDSIISESSNFPITKEFLEKMNKYWFGAKHSVYFKS